MGIRARLIATAFFMAGTLAGAVNVQAEEGGTPPVVAAASAVADEYRPGMCKRPMQMRRINALGYNYVCAGNTIRTQGDHGQWGAFEMYTCHEGFQPVRDAEGRNRTCIKRAPGSLIASGTSAPGDSTPTTAPSGKKLKITLRNSTPWKELEAGEHSATPVEQPAAE